MNKEIWKDIKSYEGIYQVSDKGNVKTLRGRKRLLKLHIKTDGYHRVSLCVNYKVKYCQVHVLVWNAFGNKRKINGYEIDHINAIKNDNRIENLQLITHSENIKKNHRERPLDTNKYLSNKKLKGCFSMTEAAKLYGCSKQYISNLIFMKRLPAYRVGGRFLIESSEVEKLLEKKNANRKLKQISK